MMIKITLGLTLGVFAWLFLEYLLHRFLGHWTKGKNAFSVEHLRHHRETHYFAPTWKKVLAWFITASASCTLFYFVFDPYFGITFAVGFSSMYGVYEILHRRAHTHPPTNFYGRWQRKHHFYHHFENTKKNHGVTTPLWDIIFRTLATRDKVRVPKKVVMSWLVNKEELQIVESYRNDYELRGGREAPVGK